MEGRTGKVDDGARRELAVAAFLVAFGGVVVALARRIPPGVYTDPLGPAAFPIALGAGIAICGLLLGAAMLTFRGHSGFKSTLAEPGPDDDQTTGSGPFSPALLIGAIAATAVYLVGFTPLGYLVVTPPYVLAIMVIHGGAGRRSLLVGPLLVTAALYATFRYGLLIPIPDGILEVVLR